MSVLGGNLAVTPSTKRHCRARASRGANPRYASAVEGPDTSCNNLAEFRFPEFSHVPLDPTRRTLPGLPSRVQRYLRAGLIRYSARIDDSAGVVRKK